MVYRSTSRDARARAEPKGARRRQMFYDWLTALDKTFLKGATDAEMQVHFKLRSQSQTPRRDELARMGLVRDSEDTRETPRGCSAIVWVIVLPVPPGVSPRDRPPDKPTVAVMLKAAFKAGYEASETGVAHDAATEEYFSGD